MEKESLREAVEELVEAWGDFSSKIPVDLARDEFTQIQSLLEELNEKVR